MAIQKKIYIFGFISFLIIMASLAVSQLLLKNDLPLADSIVSNLLMVFTINLLFFTSIGLQQFKEVRVSRKLQYLGQTLFGLISLNFIVLIMLNSEFLIGERTRLLEASEIIATLVNSIIIFATVYISVLILRHFYGMVLVKRKKSTSRNFWVLYALINVYLILSGFTKVNIFFSGFVNAETLPQNMTLALGIGVIYFIVINSLRISWINYLNRIRKIKTLFGTVILVITVISIEEASGANMQNFILSYSHAAGTFFGIIRVYLIVYSFISILILLLHLPTAGIFDKKAEQLSAMHEVAFAVAGETSNELFQLVTDKLLKVVEADAAWLFIKNAKSDNVDLVSWSQSSKYDLRKIKQERFKGLATAVLESKDFFKIDAIQDSMKELIPVEIRTPGGSINGTPISKQNGDKIGVLISWKDTEYGFDEQDREVSSAYANQTALAVENRLLFEETLEKERLQQELNVARDIQLKLLPKSIPEISEQFDIEAMSEPAMEVGGDYYDFIKLDKDNWGIYIGDVSGKSISAALYMAEIKGFIQSLAKLYKSPKDLLIKVNETLFDNIDRKSFITFVAAVLNTKKKTLTFTRAGHCSPLYYDIEKSEWEFLTPSGIGLGLDNGKIFDKTLVEYKISLKPGSVLFLYTDGVTELFDENNNEFGEEKLLEVVKNCRINNENNYTSVIQDELSKFQGKGNYSRDDMTMIVIKVKK